MRSALLGQTRAVLRELSGRGGRSEASRTSRDSEPENHGRVQMTTMQFARKAYDGRAISSMKKNERRAVYLPWVFGPVRVDRCVDRVENGVVDDLRDDLRAEHHACRRDAPAHAYSYISYVSYA